MNKKGLTKEQALEKIFSKANMTSTERTWKHRFKNNQLSLDVQDHILKQNNYVILEPSTYIQK